MMDNTSFIKLHRKMLDWEWYDNTNTKMLFIHLLLIASWKENKWHGIKLHPGDLIRTNENLAQELGISIQQVKTAISNLKSTHEITCKKVGRIRIITVKNWGLYQGNNPKITQSATQSQPDNNLIVTAYKEGKEGKKVRSVYANTPPAREEVEDYCRQVGYLSVDVDKFMDYNSAKGWAMDWKKALDLWYRKDHGSRPKTGNQFGNIMTHDYDFEALEKALVGNGS